MPSWKDFLKKPARGSTASSGSDTSSAETRPAQSTSSSAAAQQPTATKSADEPATASAEQPAAEKPAAEKPAAEKPAAEKPAAEKPAERPAKKEAPVAKTTQSNKVETKDKEPSKGRETGKKVVAGANALRARIASIVWLVAVICAATLAVAALMVALKMNPDNAIVKFITDLAKAIDFGKFKDFTGKNAHTKEALTNYGISAVIYLVVGKILDRIIRP